MSHSEKHDEELRERPTLDEDADPVKAQQDYVEAHLGGRAPATPQAYQQALEQWHALPGAVRAPPAELTGPGGLPPNGEKPPCEPNDRGTGEIEVTDSES
jgi:hypothetical protein